MSLLGFVISEEGFGNPDADLIMNCRKAEQAGIRTALEKYQLEPKLLLAEITETMLAENASLVENAIQGLHRKGFYVMMDDFGSGYSSLNMLKDTTL